MAQPTLPSDAQLEWPTAPGSGADQPTWLSTQSQKDGAMGMTQEERQRFYHLAEGSEFLPLSWFLALRVTENGKEIPFSQTLSRYGLIPDAKSANNRAGMPIGLTADYPADYPSQLFTGVNCAACHVGQIRTGGKTYIVDGAPNMFDVERFFADTATTLVRNVFLSPMKFYKRVRQYAHVLNEKPESAGPQMIPLNGRSTDTAPPADPRFHESTNQLLDEYSGPRVFSTTPNAPRPTLAQELIENMSDDSQVAEAIPIDRPEELERFSEGCIKSVKDRFIDMLKRITSRPGMSKADSDRAQEILTDDAEAKELACQRLKFVAGRIWAAARGGTVETRGGFGRTDAWGTARILLFPGENKVPRTAPIGYPHLWGFSQIRWFHWIGNTTSIEQRNIGQSLGLTAIVNLKTYASTVDLRNQQELETLVRTIRTPKWSDVKEFPPLDPEKVKAGAKLYKTLKCGGCHDAVDVGKTWDVQTDHNQIDNFNRKLTDSGKEFVTELHRVLEAVEAKALAAAEARGFQLRHPDPTQQIWRPAKGYVARPLAGIWASSPYLHNGSVPTLDALLMPPDERPKSFGLAAPDFDPQLVGYQITGVAAGVDGKPLDVTEAGNSNKGHAFPPISKPLNPTDRAALVEYLKSL